MRIPPPRLPLPAPPATLPVAGQADSWKAFACLIPPSPPPPPPPPQLVKRQRTCVINPPTPPPPPSLSQVKPGVRMLPIPLQPQQLVMRARACVIAPLPRAAPAPATLPVAGQSRSWKVTTMAHGAAAPHRPVKPGQRHRAGPRPPRDGAAGPGFNCRGTAPPGRARLARMAGGCGLFGAQGCAGSPAVSENVCGMRLTALQQEEPPARTRNPELGPGNSGRQGGENCAHLSSHKENLHTLETEPRKICALSENVHKNDVHTHRNTETKCVHTPEKAKSVHTFQRAQTYLCTLAMSTSCAQFILCTLVHRAFR
jgi:hypothetical protein